MIVLSDDLDISLVDEPPLGTPWIGYHNVVTSTNIEATEEEALFPATNLANTATHLYWRADAVADNDAFVKVLLHFNDTDSPPVITDSNAGGSSHTWTSFGNAQVDTDESKLGGASWSFDGTGDYLSTPDHADFTLGSSDFTIDLWFKANDAGGTIISPGGQVDAAGGGNTNSAWFIEKSAANVIEFNVVSGTTVTKVTGTTEFTNAVNTGWHHVAAVRTSNVLKLFIDGVQEGGDVAFSSTINNSTGALTLGRPGDFNGEYWNGWIDEFRLSVGTARWTEDFTVPDAQYERDIYITVTTNYSDDIDYLAIATHNLGTIGSTVSVEGRTGDSPDWVEIVQETILVDDTPVIFRFVPQTLTQVRLRIQDGSGAPQISVMYVGKLLVLERSIKVDVDHVPLKYGRRSTIVNGMSESGNFLGRVVLKEFRESTAEFSHFTPDWYRTYFDPFVIASKTIPFFFAWHPITYPNESGGYAWMINDPQPAVNPVTQRIAVDLEMRGVS